MSDPLRDAYVAALEEENEDLRFKLRDLEKSFGFHNAVPLMFDLTASESKVLSMLSSRDMATKAQLMTAIMTDRGADEEPELKIVDVYVCKIRKKLEPFGVKIETVWGRGYRIDSANKKKIADYLTIDAEGVAA